MLGNALVVCVCVYIEFCGFQHFCFLSLLFIIYYLLILLQEYFIKYLIFLSTLHTASTPPPQAGNFDRNKNELTNQIPEHCHCERSVAIQVYNMCSALPNYFFIYLDTHARYHSLSMTQLRCVYPLPGFAVLPQRGELKIPHHM